MVGRGAVARPVLAGVGKLGKVLCVVTIGNSCLASLLCVLQVCWAGTGDPVGPSTEEGKSDRDSVGVENPQAVERLLCGLLFRTVGLFPSTSLFRWFLLTGHREIRAAYSSGPSIGLSPLVLC